MTNSLLKEKKTIWFQKKATALKYHPAFGAQNAVTRPRCNPTCVVYLCLLLVVFVCFLTDLPAMRVLVISWMECRHILDGVWSYPGWRKSSKRSQIKDGKDDDGSDGSNALVSRETAISVSGVHRGLYRGPGLPPWRHRLVNQPSQPSQTHPPATYVSWTIYYVLAL